MTYSPDHVADGQHLIALVDTLERDLTELRQMATAYGDAVTMPGRRPDVDADGTGRQATHGPSRPVEAMALDERRAALCTELKNGVRWLPYAIAAVRGVSASMDRALHAWEGEEPVQQLLGD
ncbi:hypothetical protein ACFVRU_03735 [Streptomyces sp. NPDC057927]